MRASKNIFFIKTLLLKRYYGKITYRRTSDRSFKTGGFMRNILLIYFLFASFCPISGKTNHLASTQSIDIPYSIRSRYISGFKSTIPYRIEFGGVSGINASVYDYCYQDPTLKYGDNCFNSLCSPSTVRGYNFVYSYSSSSNSITLEYLCSYYKSTYPALCAKSGCQDTRPVNFPVFSAWSIISMTPTIMKIDAGQGYIQFINSSPRLEPEFYPDSLSAFYTNQHDSLLIHYIVNNVGYGTSSVWSKCIVNSSYSDSEFIDSLQPNYYCDISFKFRITTPITNATVIVDPMNLDTEMIETNNTISASWNTPVSINQPQFGQPLKPRENEKPIIFVYDLRGRWVCNLSSINRQQINLNGVYLLKYKVGNSILTNKQAFFKYR